MNETDSSKLPSKERSSVYESAIDLWVAVLLFMGPAFASAVAIYLLSVQKHSEASLMFVTAAITLVVTAAFTMPCRYTLLEDTLSIRCGIIFYQVSLADIEKVERSSSMKSAPALSLSRVAIKTAKRTYLISPKGREEFIVELKKALPKNPDV